MSLAKVLMNPCSLILVKRPQSGELLLVKRKDVPVWVIPGGGIDPGETAEMAARRELFEETGLTVKTLKLRAHLIPKNRLAGETFFFEADEVEGNLLVTDETSGCGYFKIGQLPKSLFPIHEMWLKRVLEAVDLVEGFIEELSWKLIITYVISHPLITLKWIWTRIKSK